MMRFLIADGPTNTISTCEEGGGNRHVLITDGMTPNWTPDRRIIFVALRGTPQIWIMDENGSNQWQLANLPWSGVEGGPIMPQLAWNGTLVFQKQMASGSEIHAMHWDGSNERVLVHSDQHSSPVRVVVAP